MSKQYWVYILCSARNGTLYVGITSDLARRVYEHKHSLIEGFTKKYGVKTLVHAEVFDDVHAAIRREKILKGWNRSWKISLIEEHNPHWEELDPRSKAGMTLSSN